MLNRVRVARFSTLLRVVGIFLAVCVIPNGIHSSFAQESDAGLNSEGLEQIVSKLERRVNKLKAMDAVENLQRQFGYYYDKKMWPEVAALFSEDGSFETAQRGVYFGRARIKTMLDTFYGETGLQPGDLFDHMQVQPIIQISDNGDSATMRIRVIVQKGQRNQKDYWAGGIYENEFIKQDNKWFIKKIHYYDTYEADYNGGWTQSYLPIATDSKDFPPDEPPTEKFGSYPEVYIPPFSFSHPTASPVLAVSTFELLNNGGLDAKVVTRVKSLQKKIQSMEDEAEIEKLQRTYGYYVDKGLWEETAQLFAEEGTLEIGGRGVFVGRDRVLQYYRFLGHDGPQVGALVNHIQLQPIVHINPNGKTAKGRFNFLAQIGVIPQAELNQKQTQTSSEEVVRQSQNLFRTGLWGIGTYENEYEKIDGIWHIKTLYGVFRMYTFYGSGWAMHAEANTRPEETLPPDLPPTVEYDMYPSVYFQPFHYDHLVTGERHRADHHSNAVQVGGDQ